VLGLVALLLGVTGLYGLIAYDVARRTREVGIRMALGSTKGAVVALFLRQGVRLVAPGIAIGLLVAAFASRGLSALLIGVSPLDPLSFAAVPLVLIAVAVAATIVPARRAAHLDPSRALRQD
jgi:putative ABC transport system permease protein